MKKSTILFLFCAIGSMIVAERTSNDLVQGAALSLFILFLVFAVSDGESYLSKVRGALPVVGGLLAMTAIGIGIAAVFTILTSITPKNESPSENSRSENPCTDYNPYQGSSC